MAPGLRGLRGRWAHSLSVAPGGAGACSSAATEPVGLARPLLSRSQPPVTLVGAKLLPFPPQTDAPRQPHEPCTNFCPTSPTSAPGSDLRSRNGAPRAAWAAARADQPRRDVLATVALVLLRLGGCRLAARKRPTAPAGHAKCL
nr:uncharacterized protein LOC100441889 isoform X2 [Pongo abelii]